MKGKKPSVRARGKPAEPREGNRTRHQDLLSTEQQDDRPSELAQELCTATAPKACKAKMNICNGEENPAKKTSVKEPLPSVVHKRRKVSGEKNLGKNVKEATEKEEGSAEKRGGERKREGEQSSAKAAAKKALGSQDILNLLDSGDKKL